MSAPNDSTPQPKVARSRFQFSLRVLLVAFTLFAIGFPIWYRWPYEEHVNEPNTLGDRQTIIWQRQWGGERLQVGKRFYSKDRLILTLGYQDGELHGEWKRFHNDGTIKESRQYFEGKKHGAWVEYSPNGQPRSLSTYHRGKLHGLWEMEQFDGTILRLRFDLGRLTSINNLQPHERLIELLDRGTIDSVRVAAALRSNSMLEFIEESTETIAFHAGETHGIIIVADPRTTKPAPPLTINIETDLATALTIVAQHGGFECDYRYGCVWITEAKGIEYWSDPTGVAQIQPADGTPLAGAWRELVSAPVVSQALSDILQILALELGLEIDATEIETIIFPGDRFAQSLEANKLPFKHFLAMLLYRTKCRCVMDGQRIVILPPETIE